VPRENPVYGFLEVVNRRGSQQPNENGTNLTMAKLRYLTHSFLTPTELQELKVLPASRLHNGCERREFVITLFHDTVSTAEVIKRQMTSVDQVPSRSSPIYCSLIVLPFNAVGLQSELHMSLNKQEYIYIYIYSYISLKL
jgi:hypothetical protein